MSRVVPAEWSPHRAMWVGFPSREDLWEDDLAPAQAETAALARALADPGGERVRLLVMGDAAEAAARELLDGAPVEIVRGLFGDIWLRDTGPIYVEEDERPRPVSFTFNGWGGKYALEHDEGVGEQLAAAAGQVLAGERVVDPALAAAALSAGPNPLSDRERDVLHAAVDGVTVADIAARLHLSESTVRNYLSAAIGKTNTRNRIEAAHRARSNGWI